jgi:phenylalanine-4-hydroxylase
MLVDFTKNRRLLSAKSRKPPSRGRYRAGDAKPGGCDMDGMPDLRGPGPAADHSVPQNHAAIAEADHATWRRLISRQAKLLPDHAARTYREGLARLDCAQGIPDLARASERLRDTGWRLVGVPGLIPEDAFFAHLAARRFPVTVWIRRPEELDYLEEPDIFHDFAGHVPLLTNRPFADFLQAYGALGAWAERIGALKPLARLYWHMVEFGLIEEAGGLRAYGAGILSSAAETVFSTTSSTPRRLCFEPRRVLRSDYQIDALQPTYFVIRDPAELFAVARALPDLLAEARDAPAIPPGAGDPTDLPFPIL